VWVLVDVDVDVSWHCPSVTTMVTMMQDANDSGETQGL